MNSLRLVYIRSGHQANSSSDHRILIDPSLKPVFATDDELQRVTQGLIIAGLHGRQWEKLDNPADKLDYIFVALFNMCEHVYGWDGAAFNAFIEERYGAKAALVTEGWGAGGIEGYIDHQSIGKFPIPLTYGGKEVNWDLFDYILKLFVGTEHLVIFLGNDEELSPDGYCPPGWKDYNNDVLIQALERNK